MKRIITALLIVVWSVSLLGAKSTNNQAFGIFTGALAGGIVGSHAGNGNGKLFTTAAGFILGAFLGNAIGKEMDKNDARHFYMALDDMPYGEPAHWRNDDTGVDYEVIPVKTVYVRGYHYCRKYHTIAYIDGKKRHMYGTACRQPNGTWKAID